MEHGGQRVGDSRHCAVGVAVGVVDRLYEPARGYVVFCYGDFEEAVVRELAGGLHESFPERAVAYHNTSVKVLDGSVHDFGS